MSEIVKGWICARCAVKHNVVAGTEPVVLLPCGWCGVQNWVRPVGHAGENVTGATVVPVVESIPVHIEVVNDDLEVVAEKTIQVDPEHTEEAIKQLEEFEKEIESVPVEEAIKVEEKEPENKTKTLEEQLAEAKALVARLEGEQ